MVKQKFVYSNAIAQQQWGISIIVELNEFKINI